MNKLTSSILISCALLTACQKDKVEAAVQPTQAVQYSPVITGRACLNGLSMLRVQFTNTGVANDSVTWVYEYLPFNHSPVRCNNP